jgi:hypothetical protein
MKMVNLAHRQEITSLVSSLADRKRQDLDTLRAFLLSPETEGNDLFERSKEENDGRVSAPEVGSSSNNAVDSMKTTTGSIRKQPSVQGDAATPRNCLRCLALDLPLMLLFATFCVVYVMRFAWTDYYVPIMERARRTDEGKRRPSTGEHFSVLLFFPIYSHNPRSNRVNGGVYLL